MKPERFHPAYVPTGQAPGTACSTCGFFDCVCAIKIDHKDGCRYKAAMLCPVGIACSDHGRDVCSICDPCTCAIAVTPDMEVS